MGALWQDVRYGLRMLVKKPGFTLAAVVALALGIGANTAIFSVVNSVLLRPLDYREPERLVFVNHVYPQLDLVAPVTGPTYVLFSGANSFESAAATYNFSYNLTNQGDPERLIGRRVTAGFFPLLGAEAGLGRVILPEEDQPGREKVVVLSHGLWQRRFGGSAEIVGQTLTLNGEGYTVVGVMPARFRYGQDELWTPVAFTPEQVAPAAAGREYLGMIARLKPGVTVEQAHAEINVMGRQFVRETQGNDPGEGVFHLRVMSMHEQIVGDIRPMLLILLGAVGFLLLIACANVANLLLARATARRKEIAIRTALGAGRRRIVRQLLTESVLLSLAGGACGLILAIWGVELLLSLNPDNIPRARDIGIDARVLGFTFGLSLVTGLLFGLVPALQASKTSLTETLKEGGRGSAAGFRWRSARSLLVVGEVAVALVLLVGAGLMVRSFARLLDVNPGFDPQGVLTMQVALPAFKYPEAQQRRAFYQQLMERMRALPGVEAVGAVSALPLSGSVSSGSFQIEGRETAQGEMSPHTDQRVITPDYLQTMRIPLLRGRQFDERDHADAPLVVIIDETLARTYWPNQDPLGQRVSFSSQNGTRVWREIIGIAGPIKHRAVEADWKGQLYTPHAQNSTGGLTLVIRAAAGGEPQSLAMAAQTAVRSIDPDQPVYNVRTMEAVYNQSVAQKRFSMLLMTGFAGVALLLAAVGLFGVMNYTVAQRTHEIGIRMALGARARDVLRMVVGQGMALALAGVGIGLVAAFALTRVMRSLLYEVSATDPVTFIVISLLLLAVAFLANFIPARRAAKVDPMVALRYE